MDKEKKDDNAKGDAAENSEDDTLAPMQSQQRQQHQQQQHQQQHQQPSQTGGGGGGGRAMAAAAAAVASGRRGTVAAGGPRKSIAGGLMGRATLMTLGNLARRSKAQEVRLENTYRMLPKDEERLRCWKLRPCLAESLADVLASYDYNSLTAGRKACDAALAIRNRVREAGYERYKFVVCVVLLENRCDSTVELASRALLSRECADNSTEAAYTGKTVRAHATVHAFYYE